MVKREALEKDFSFLKQENVLAVLLFGSSAKREESRRSDIDVCVVAPNCSRLDLLKRIYTNLDVHGKNYDVRIFEDLPLYIKAQIIENNEIIFTRDIYELYEYFYFFRKLWEDQARRQKLTKKELAEMLE